MTAKQSDSMNIYSTTPCFSCAIPAVMLSTYMSQCHIVLQVAAALNLSFLLISLKSLDFIFYYGKLFHTRGLVAANSCHARCCASGNSR